MSCRRFLVSGRVQGVWFRQSTRREAERLGITGSAVNLSDGRVEVIACGSADSLDQLERWLWQGPDMARVSDVSVERLAEQDMSGFRTG